MDISATAREQITSEAIDWFLVLHGAGRSAADQAAFSDWLLRSPVHIEEYLAVSTTWVGLGAPAGDEFSAAALFAAARESGPTNVVPFEGQGGGARQNVLNPSRSRRRSIAAAAGILLCAIGVAVLFHARQGAPYATDVGEQRSISLPDGSVVFLNTNSAIRATWSNAARSIDLMRGEARFQVAKDSSRPFVVSTQDATIRALGTIFNVRADTATTEIAVMEGRVEVARSGPPAPVRGEGEPEDPSHPVNRLELSTGQRASVTSNGIEPNVGPSIARVTAWTERRLVFRGESLADVVAEFNRYRRKALVIDDPRLAGLHISGVFDSSDPDSLVAYLESFQTVKVGRPGDGSVHLSLSASIAEK